MATNSSRGNDIATVDGPRFDQTPPPASADIKADIKSASSHAVAEGEHRPGHHDSTTDTDGLSAPEAEQKREMEGLGRSEAAKRG